MIRVGFLLIRILLREIYTYLEELYKGVYSMNIKIEHEEIEFKFIIDYIMDLNAYQLIIESVFDNELNLYIRIQEPYNNKILMCDNHYQKIIKKGHISLNNFWNVMENIIKNYNVLMKQST